MHKLGKKLAKNERVSTKKIRNSKSLGQTLPPHHSNARRSDAAEEGEDGRGGAARRVLADAGRERDSSLRCVRLRGSGRRRRRRAQRPTPTRSITPTPATSMMMRIGDAAMMIAMTTSTMTTTRMMNDFYAYDSYY